MFIVVISYSSCYATDVMLIMCVYVCMHVCARVYVYVCVCVCVCMCCMYLGT